MLLFKNAELHGYLGAPRIADVRCRAGIISEIGTGFIPAADERVIDAQCQALIPGLHDHHLHLLALAATDRSISCGPPHIHHEAELCAALQSSGSDGWVSDGWIRAIDYHESVAGDLDRWKLDQWVPHRPLRIQHRSGILWILNSCAIEQLQLQQEHREGLERNEQGELTGRLWRLDHWLRDQMGQQDVPALTNISQQLAHYGITGVTDTSAHNNAETLNIFQAAMANGELRQRLVLMGNEQLPLIESSTDSHALIQRGALKILLDEFRLPDWEVLQARIHQAHQQQRPVAFHCVTDAQLIFALSALMEAGPHPRDRIEHASLCSSETFPLLQSTGVAVVTQPGLLSLRGKQYQQEIPTEQQQDLYRCKSFLNFHIPLVLSSDAPYGPLNPWHNMQAAIERQNENGVVLGPQEKLTPEEALLCYLRDPVDLTRHRRIDIGMPADFSLLTRKWSDVRNAMGDNPVQLCVVAGSVITD